MFPSLHRVLFAALLAVAGVQGRPQTNPDAPIAGNSSTAIACNNSPTLCSRNYNEVSHFGAHNSAFLRDASTGDSLAGNQYKNATLALDAGLRLLQAQVHDSDGVLHLCHGSCGILDAGPLQTWLQAVNVWVEAHPNDVVTILLVNAKSRPAAEFGAVFQAAGIAQHGFAPSVAPGPMASWPTLQAMIDSGGRVVSFVTNIDAAPPEHPYLLPEFYYVFETHFEVTEIDGFNCTIDRPNNRGTATEALAAGYLSLVNHFKYQTLFGGIMVPDVDTLPVVNSAGSGQVGNIGRHMQQCAGEWSRVPNFVLVDFWSEADPIAAVDQANAVTDVQGRRAAGGGPTGGGSGGAEAYRRSLGHGALLPFLAGALLVV
ncbi:PLC-like phosphodiesterase [Paramyrothecium foliicola]|nr:PLC-like phosphodiesterase [Paramyrothecium foliicola]